jgi:hypothetical protein
MIICLLMLWCVLLVRLPIPSGHREPKPLPSFERTDIAAINAFEKELGITIPPEILKSVPMYKYGYFFSSKDGFMGTHVEPAFVKMVEDRANVPLVAFGQTGYGFNSGRFEFYYISDTLGYHLNVGFGGAFMDNRAIAKEITTTLSKLPALETQYHSTDGKTVTVVLDKGRSQPSVLTINL